MLFTISSKVLIHDKKDNKYYVKDVEAIDCYHDIIYTNDFSDKSKSISFSSIDCVIKPHLLQFGSIDIYSGDIVEIKKGNRVNKYELHLLDGEILFKNINNGMEIDVQKIINKPGVEISVTPYHYNKKRELIEISEDC